MTINLPYGRSIVVDAKALLSVSMRKAPPMTAFAAESHDHEAGEGSRHQARRQILLGRPAIVTGAGGVASARRGDLHGRASSATRR
jgi:hypothetical protein